jgi:hypothetical protein
MKGTMTSVGVARPDREVFLVLMAIWALLLFTGLAKKYRPSPAGRNGHGCGGHRESAAWRCAI